jgi:predicted nucleic acid-binding protein
MIAVFADTSYFLAFLGENDQYHDRAVAWTRVLRARVLTSEYVVMEVGNSLTRGGDRAVFTDFYQELRGGASFEVVPASSDLQDRGAKLFADRPDKEWSLTDCTSFVIMSDRGIQDALTTDRDFEEAGFRVLLRHPPDQP